MRDKLKIIEEKLNSPAYAWLRHVLAEHPEAGDFWQEFIQEQAEKLEGLNPEARDRFFSEAEAGLKIEKQKFLRKYIEDYERNRIDDNQ